MFKKIKQLICKIFHIKACQCPDDIDEHVEFFLNVPKPDVPVHKPTHCGSHTRFIKSCHQCIATQA